MAVRKRVGSHLAQTQRLVEAAETIPAQIDRHVRVAERAELRTAVVGHRRLQRAGDLIAAEFESRDRVVMTDTADSESKIVQHRVGAFYPPKLLVGRFTEVRDARR